MLSRAWKMTLYMRIYPPIDKIEVEPVEINNLYFFKGRCNYSLLVHVLKFCGNLLRALV